MDGRLNAIVWHELAWHGWLARASAIFRNGVSVCYLCGSHPVPTPQISHSAISFALRLISVTKWTALREVVLA